jgi:5-deoxy-glucuronate isomerase
VSAADRALGRAEDRAEDRAEGQAGPSSVRVPAALEPGQPGLVARVTPESAGWNALGVESRRLAAGEAWAGQTGDAEAVLVVLGGRCRVETSRGDWASIGRRAHPFAGLPWALYLPRDTGFALTALDGGADLALATAPTDRDHPIRLIRPEDTRTELRGGGQNSRQIVDVVPPGFDCARLVCCEVYTPHGNWSSYPPHKHDTHLERDGVVLEADLEEVYLYRFARPEGFAVQRVYTADGRRDETVVARHGDVVLVPEGYHPVSAAFGYDCYYLNFLAGSAQSLAATDDPDHAWVKTAWGAPDPRLPMVALDRESA